MEWSGVGLMELDGVRCDEIEWDGSHIYKSSNIRMYMLTSE